MLILLMLSTILLSVLGYRYFGRFLERRCQIDPNRETPACSINDGVDYVPTRASVVFGHHFSSVAGAGPIVGPIAAAAAFGWGPTWLWILLGAIYIGAVHDFGSTVMSLRYRGRTIIETCRELVGEGTGRLFLIFVLIALIYVVIVFLDLTADGFAKQPQVSTASGWFILMAVIFGWVMRAQKLPFSIAAPLFIALTYAGLVLGQMYPTTGVTRETWIIVILVYCYLAAILPVNVLMQPRDFLSATFLYALVVLGMGGLFLTDASFEMPFFTTFKADNLGYLMPFLFITVACGACSGFHSMIASGTTSKQLQSEADVRKVSYGAMLVEGVLATFAIACVGVLGGLQGSPVVTFSKGAAVFFSHLGIPSEWGVTFAMLSLSTFLLTTLDTCTRLARFLLEELFNWRTAKSRFLGSLAVVAIPAAVSTQSFTGADGTVIPVWRAIWPIFGATNQLVAALALVTFVVFLKSRRIAYGFAMIPVIFMVVTPMLAMAMMTFQQELDLFLRVLTAAMFLLSAFVIVMSARYVMFKSNTTPPVDGAVETL